jgi:hypothetical protein
VISARQLSERAAAALRDALGAPLRTVWRRSIAEALAVIDLLDARIGPIDRERGPLARGDARVALLDTIPGVGDRSGSRWPRRSATSRALARRAS